MKSLQKLVEMSDQERQNYLQKHKGEITYEWLRSAKKENDRRGYSNPKLAKELAEILLEAARFQDDKRILALAYWSLGNACILYDHPHEAIQNLERVSQLYTEVDQPLEVARVQISLMMAETDCGYPGKALEIAERIRPLIERSPEQQDQERLAILALNIGIALDLRGDYEAALAVYQHAQEIIRESVPEPELDIEIARVAQNRALVLTKLNRFEEAEMAYRQALDTLEAQEISSDVLRVYTSLGWLYDRAGRDEEAANAFENARVWLDRLSDQNSLQAADLTLYRLKWQLKRDPQAVMKEVAHLREIYAGRAFLYEQEAALLEARAHLRIGDVEDTRRICAEVEKMLSGRSLAGLLWRVYYLTGRAWEKEGDLDKAQSHYEKAVEIVERDQHRVADVELRASALEDKLNVYRDLALLRVKKKEYAAALEAIEQSRARALVDVLATRLSDIPPREDKPKVQRLRQELNKLRAELDYRYKQQRKAEGTDKVRGVSPASDKGIAQLEQAYIEKARELSRLDPAYGSVLGTYVASTTEVQQVLSPNTLLVEYYTVRGQLFVLLLTSEGKLSHYTLGEISKIESLVKQLPHQTLKSPDEEVWRELYTHLVAPWSAALEGTRRLIIVPDGPLYYVPFQALLDADDYLIEHYDISYAPSATLLALNAQRSARRRDAMLALGYDGGQLPHVSAEMGAIAGAFPELTMFIGAQAGRKRLEMFVDQADVIHVAAHGDFRSEAPLFSFITLADGRWQAADVYRQRTEASLVTLGACQTGRGRLTGSDLVGFAHALFYAGAQAAMVSLWPVHDASTAALMTIFYRGIREGLSKSAALRQAQQALLQSDKGQWRNPFYWAPFCLIGSDGIVGVAGLLRAVRRIAESEKTSPKLAQVLQETLLPILETYIVSGEQIHIEKLVAEIETIPGLKGVLASVTEDLPDLSQAIGRVGRAAEDLMAWRWPSGEDMEEVSTGKRPLGPATPSKSPVVTSASSEGGLRWSGKLQRALADGDQTAAEAIASRSPTYNETVREAEKLMRALTEDISRIQRSSVKKERHDEIE